MRTTFTLAAAAAVSSSSVLQGSAAVEAIRRASEASTCRPQSTVLAEGEYHLRNNRLEEAGGCLWLAAKAAPRDASVLNSLATMCRELGREQLASDLFAESAKLGAGVLQPPVSWDYLGPFVTGKGELDGDPTAAYGGVHRMRRGSGHFLSEVKL
jgi:hypothetical protein